MSSPEDTPGFIQDTEDLAHEGDWFRPQGKGFWHLQAHQEYGVAWSLCGVRLMLSQAETSDRLDLAAGNLPCANCQHKARQEARKRGD